jgi:hypothetical protein
MALACGATPVDLGAGLPAARDGAVRLQLRHTQVAVVIKFDTQGNLVVVTQFRLLPAQLSFFLGDNLHTRINKLKLNSHDVDEL